MEREDSSGVGSEPIFTEIGDAANVLVPGAEVPFVDFSEGATDRNLITARGTGDGLIIRLNGQVDKAVLSAAFIEFLNTRRRFLSGNEVTFEWIGALPESSFVEELSQKAKEYDIEVKSSSLKDLRKPSPLKEQVQSTRSKPEYKDMSLKSKGGSEGLGIFGGIDPLHFDDEVTHKRVDKNIGFSTPAVDSNVWDEADARIIFATVRSGQKIETEHSLVVIGDVNSGAELIAGGDIIVLGTLRGVAHAGAYDESGGGRVIFALSLQPTQLRIGSVISRGMQSSDRMASDKKQGDKKGVDLQRGAEIARADGNTVVVEAYQAKATLSRRRD